MLLPDISLRLHHRDDIYENNMKKHTTAATLYGAAIDARAPAYMLRACSACFRLPAANTLIDATLYFDALPLMISLHS